MPEVSEKYFPTISRRISRFNSFRLQEVINIDQMKVKFDVGGMRIHLDNLFNGNKVLSASFSMFLNQNSKEILGELQEDLEGGLGEIFMGIWNSVYNKMPIKYWLVWMSND